jgi:hypothetical protein
MIQLYLQGGHAMGDTLMSMCLFNSLNQPVHITTGIDSWYTTWKRIFNIGNQINLDPVINSVAWIDPPHPKHLESFKIFSRYDQFDYVNVFGQSLPIGRRGKKLAAVLINDGNYVKDFEFFSNSAFFARFLPVFSAKYTVSPKPFKIFEKFQWI